MNKAIGILAFALVGFGVAACGGGGSGSSALPAVNPTPTTTSPAATPTPGTGATTLSGHVYTLGGPLASQGLAAPTGCTVPTQACAAYPTAPPSSALPGPQATPIAGAPVSGVTIYVTTASGVVSANVPTSPVATATSAADGSFSVSVPAGQYGLFVTNGTLASGSAVTSSGYAVTRTLASTGTAATVYVGVLSGDEQSAFATVNTQRATLGYAALSSDLTAQMAARLGVAQRVGAAVCDDNGVASVYASLGGVSGSGAFSWQDTLGPSWLGIANYGTQTVVNTQGVVYAGLAAIYQASACNPSTNLGGAAYNYFEGYAVL